MNSLFRKLHRDDRGTTLVVVAIALPVLLGMLVLIFDLGSLIADKRPVVAASDAAALAAARSCAGLPPYVTAEAAADTLATANVDGIEGGITASENCGIATAPTETMGAVKVDYSWEREPYFASIFGVDSSTVTSTATATWGWTTAYQGTIDPLATQVFVCKYVGAPPGLTLKNGKNPIKTSTSSTAVGDWSFNDAQWSYVLATAPQADVPDATDCPTLNVRLVA